MINKDTTFRTFRNSVITPDLVKQGIDNLPADYIKKSIKLMELSVSENIFPKVFSKQYIINVRKSKAFNKDILDVLIFIGLQNKLLMETYGRKKSSITA